MELLTISGRQLEGGPQGYSLRGFIGFSIKLEGSRQLDISDPTAGLIDIEAHLLVFLVLVKQAIFRGVVSASRRKPEGIVIPVNKAIRKPAPLDYVGNHQPDFKILGDSITCIQAEPGA